MRPIARPRHKPHSTPTRSGVVRAVGLTLIVCAVAGAGFAVGLRASSGQQPDASGTLRALLRRGGGAAVYSEFGDSADTIWAANPSDPNDRVALGSAPHAAGFGVYPSLSPDGKYVAYAAQTGAGAELWLIETASGNSRRLASGVDLQSTPVWSNDSAAVVARRSNGGDEKTPLSAELLRVDLQGNVSSVASAAAGLYPIAFAPDGTLYYASLSTGGTDLERAGGNSGEHVAHLSDGIARDWDLSPDGTRLAYLTPGGAGFAANVVDVTDGKSGGIASSSGPAFHPIWAPDGSLTVGQLGGSSAGAALRVAVDGGAASALPSASSGFDVPLSWSPDGRYLIVRHFEGASTADPGPSWLWTIDPSGQRRRLSDISDLAVAGWLENAP